jgi:hypothetical protein
MSSDTQPTTPSKPLRLPLVRTYKKRLGLAFHFACLQIKLGFAVLHPVQKSTLEALNKTTMIYSLRTPAPVHLLPSILYERFKESMCPQEVVDRGKPLSKNIWNPSCSHLQNKNTCYQLSNVTTYSRVKIRCYPT